eukprot:TRINITY_DN6298_c0_g2_i13.p1 TRINITY_DN6298_c0_g2~~TRINITY_DN6298_c0_g2_i13.p1  ORF type:complete len:705 (-),score=257.78 TRINITY_DN6298_c0_g2_i13:235-2349(-)
MMNLEKMKVAELRDELEKRGLDTKGTKPFLVERLKEALTAEAEGGGGDVSMEEVGGAGEQQQQPEADANTEEVEMENGDEEEETPAQNGDTNGVAENGGEEVKVKQEKEGEEEKPKVGVKRKFGEVSAQIEELKPWTVHEDEPEIKEGFVCLDWYNSDLNLKIKHDEFLSAMPLNRESWSWIYAGCRATHGVTSGKVFYEIHYKENMRVYTEKDGGHLDLRVGWSTNNATRQLGEDDISWGYSSAEGKKAHNGEFEEYGAKVSERGDVIGAYLDMEGSEVVMSFTKNGVSQGEAFRFPKSDLKGEALFPHILSRNVKFTAVFGKDKDLKEVDPVKPCEDLEGYTQIGKVEPENLVRGHEGIKTREECEFILMIGLPAAGKTHWAKQYMAEHPEKRFELLNATEFLNRATVWGKSRKEHTSITWEKVHHRVTKAIQDVLKVVSQRRRNVILDQTNVYVDAQVRKARPFEQYQRKAVVIVPPTEEWTKRREAQKEGGDNTIPDDALNEMKANISFPLETNTIFKEVVFPELPREEAQALLEAYNKEAQDAGFGKKHEEYQKEWEANKKMRGNMMGGGRGFRGKGFGGPGFGGGRGFGGPGRGFGGPGRGFGGGGRGFGGGSNFRGFGSFGGGGFYGAAGGRGGGYSAYGSGNWGPYGGGNAGGGFGGGNAAGGGYGGGYGGGNAGGGGGAGYGGYPGSRNWGSWGR